MNSKSPFYVVDEFISPLLCEELIDLCDFSFPDVNTNDKFIVTKKTCEKAESIIYERLLLLLPKLQEYYNIVHKGVEPIIFEWLVEGCRGEIGAENSVFVQGKWARTKQRDLTGILFLCDYQEKIPFEDDYEVYGGKLEFPQHQFGFNPRRGTLVIFPSDPHFINVTTDIFVGDLIQARIQIASQTLLLYDPTQFPGNYTTWFSNQS